MSNERLDLLDRRIIDRNVKEGVITKKSVDSHISSLPDDEANADWVTYDLEETELTEAAVDEASDSEVGP